MQDVPIIALSGVCTPEAIERGRAVGFSDYIAKFDRAGLMAALREFTASLGEAA
jgi:two-component system chemotaxis sensor kinase CheA